MWELVPSDVFDGKFSTSLQLVFPELGNNQFALKAAYDFAGVLAICPLVYHSEARVSQLALVQRCKTYDTNINHISNEWPRGLPLCTQADKTAFRWCV